VINNDQIRVHLVPIAREWTWEGESTTHQSFKDRK
jgi:hypothetical protein